MSKPPKFGHLREKIEATENKAVAEPRGAAAPRTAGRGPGREGRKAISGYYPPELSFAVHTTARRNGMTLQEALGEALNDWLRKMGESPVGL